MFNLFKNKQKKIKEYHFFTYQANCIGDKYTYDISDETKEEAFKKLVSFFFSTDSNNCFNEQNIKQQSRTIMFPNLCVEDTNLPYWFHRRISGEYNKEDNEKLIEYCKKNDIKMNQ